MLTETVRVKGERVRPTGTYRVTVNDFLANGGNGFPTFTEGTERDGGSVTGLDALVRYLENNSAPNAPLDPPEPGRITFLAG
ncbi:5'-nucleotidase C-terminal domain-containing protein [Streptomyces sp. Je 1-369]|uniref:5'-nucleotidase C-terminal domain-containing protein n=1 Tax=Streptomyces sp. Je 1-369 TaxID=2966192 RepID=UPI002AA2B0A4|nr:5'-nucleotidase C-terminal domain-containing protein [Streptomyces sp. Je 1-369]